MPGDSMLPTLQANDRFFVVKHEACPPAAGDLVVFRFPLDRARTYVKRLVAMPGEHVSVRNGVVRVDDREVAAPRGASRDYPEHIVSDGHFFVLGDNLDNSSDSRVWGDVPMSDCVGRADSIFYADDYTRLGKLN